MSRVIAYTYDADVHCRGCAGKRFGPSIHRPDVVVAGGGVIFETDELLDDMYCGDCHKLIAEKTI